MDDKWFKTKQKQAGVTSEDIAREMGRDRSAVSHIYNGRQRMTLEWAEAFSRVLDVPIEEVLQKAGTAPARVAQRLSSGFSDADATPFVSAPDDGFKIVDIGAALGADRPGVDIWHIKSTALELAGYLPGDFMLVDTHEAGRARAGDIVIAQKYDMQSGSATTILRRYEPPVLVSDTTNPSYKGVLIVDGRNVMIRGRVVASWRLEKGRPV